jgi:uncharacterized protein YcfL
MKTLASILLTFILCAGCASAPDNLARETARAVGGLRPDQVTVSEVKRTATSVSWLATTPSGVFDCSADDMVRRVNAIKREGK